VKQLQDQYNAEYPAYAKDCLDEDNSGATRLLTGQNLTKEQMADLEAKKKERDAQCKPSADRLAQLQKRNSCRTAVALQEHPLTINRKRKDKT
jgi:hypothetical protein